MTNKLYLGDCLEVLPTLEANSVDAVICDPPYFLPATHYQTRRQFARSLSDIGMLEHFYRDLFTECSRVLKETGCFYVFCDGQSYPVFFSQVYPHVRRVVPLIWDKVVSFNGYSWRHQHELIMFAEKWKAPAIPTGDGDIIKFRAVPVGDRTHPAEKPVGLIEKLIEKSCPVGSTIIDPFMGSGATGKACARTGRNFIGIEKDERYFRDAKVEIESTQQSPLFAEQIT